MNKEEKEYQKCISKNLPVPDLHDQISSKIEFNERKLFMNKKVLFSILGGSALVATCAIVIAVLPQNNVQATPKALVTMDVNPSVEFVVDENNKVLSVNGKNDEGKMIIHGESIVGKSLEDAIDIVVKVENETGYLIDGNVSLDSNTINISISADPESYQILSSQIDSYIEQACEKYNIKGEIEKGVQYTKDELIQYILTLDSTMNEEELKNKTFEELLDIVALYHLERSSICSEKLEYYYNQAKEAKIEFAENEVTKELISNVNELYQFILSGFNQACDYLSNAYISLNETIYNSFVSENSIFQKSLLTMKEYKNEVIELRNQINKYEEDNEISLEVLKAMLEQAEKSLDASMTSLQQSEDAIIEQIESAKTGIQNAINSLNEIKNSFPSEIKSDLQDLASKTETRINEIKKNFFESFEKENKEDIERFQKEVEARKQLLIDSIKNK